jgi:hypothetical protein
MEHRFTRQNHEGVDIICVAQGDHLHVHPKVGFKLNNVKRINTG